MVPKFWCFYPAADLFVFIIISPKKCKVNRLYNFFIPDIDTRFEMASIILDLPRKCTYYINNGGNNMTREKVIIKTAVTGIAVNVMLVIFKALVGLMASSSTSIAS